MGTGKLFKLTAAVTAAIGTVVLAGCNDDVPKAREAELEVAEIKGISFNDPLPEETAVQDAAIIPAPDVPTGGAPQEQPAQPATAEDIPTDIAMIPSATPVPVTPTPDATPEVQEVATAPAAPGEYKPISFKVLGGYKYIEPVPQEGERPEEVEQRRQSDQIPAEVKALDGTNAVVEGWMVPMEISEDGSVKSFVLVNTQPECCFGDMQAMNEWVDVVMKPGANAEFNVDVPVKVYGQLEVGEKTEDGFVLSIYRMKADRVEI